MPLSDQILAAEARPVAGTSQAAVPGWQEAMRRAIRDLDSLCRSVGLDPAIASAESAAAAKDFPVFVPWEYLCRIEPANPRDPLLRQVLPIADETSEAAGFSVDPVGDHPAQRAPGLLHKYEGRALLITTSACAVHCRYCFRRHFPYSESSIAAGQESVWETLEADRSLREVLFSGGDPWTLPDRQIRHLMERAAAIEHLQRVRMHTRLPIMIPQRVTPELLQALTGTRLTPWVVVHVNHPRELDPPTLDALSRIIDAGIPVLNQAVLLRGVNDSVEVLAELCERLVNHRVMPYYLHQLDRVQGAAHFEVPIAEGLRLMEELHRRLPGYAVPRYVQEAAGMPFKLPLESLVAPRP